MVLCLLSWGTITLLVHNSYNNCTRNFHNNSSSITLSLKVTVESVSNVVLQFSLELIAPPLSVAALPVHVTILYPSI